MLIQDLRFAFRSLLRRPAFTAVAVLTLALGLGANTAMFSVLRAVILRPLPFPDPGALVKIVGFTPATGQTGNLSPADFMDMARDARSFARMGAHGWVGFFTVADSTGAPERVGGVNVTHGFFPTLQAEFALGRAFTDDEDAAGGPSVVILDHGFWQRRFGGDGSIIGRTVDVNARPATVVGVLSPRFRHVEPNPERTADVYVPYQFRTADPNRGAHFIRAVGRLRDGVSVAQAQAELSTIADRLAVEYPDEKTNPGVVVTPLHDALVAEARPALMLLAAAVGLVLLVACANLANLLLVQGVSRRAELAIRSAMGAGRRRLIRQLVTESVVLSSLGAAAGVALAWAGTRVLTTLGTAGVPRAEDIAVDGVVLGFALALALVTGVVAGLVPALQVSRGDLHVAVRDGARGQARPEVQRTARELLIAAQVALALVLMVGAGLMVRSLWSLLQVAPGFSVEQVLTFDTAVPTATFPEGTQIPFYERFYAAIRSQPGVVDVGGVNILPLSATYDSRGIQIDARPASPGEGPDPQARSITPGYFQAMGIPLVRGRTFTDRDREGAPRVVIISESMARRYWPGEDAIGQRLTFNSGIPMAEQQEVGGPGSREIVGIVGDVKHLGLNEGDVPMFYTPHAQQPSYHTMTTVVRAAGDPTILTAAVRDELARIDRSVPLYRVRSLETVVRTSVAAPAMRMWLFGLFALLALSLALVGVYGIVSYLVGLRALEIGIRLALGAARGDVLRRMLLEGLRPVALGVVVGLLGSVAVGRLVAQLLFGVRPIDAFTYALVVSVLLAAAALATWVPARRVLQLDPARALRAD